MARSILEDAFAHHVWATIRLIDDCLLLPTDRLDVTAEGTYGSILETVRHLVGADVWYLRTMNGGRTAPIEEDDMDLPALRAAMASQGPSWSELVAQDLDPDVPVISRAKDGVETRTTMGIRAAQALHHGTDHRTHICTVLTTMGVEPPEIDVWAFAILQGRFVDLPPSP